MRPIVVLDQPPDGHWNWQRIFPRDTTPKPPSEQVKWGDWLRFTNASVDRRPADRALALASERDAQRARARDSVDRARRCAGGGVCSFERAPGGFQKIVQLDSVNATVPLLRLSQPGVNESTARGRRR